MSYTKEELRILRKAERIMAREHARRCLEFDRLMMGSWSDAQVMEAVAAVEAGNHDGVRFWREGKPIPAMIQALAEQLQKRDLGVLIEVEPEAGDATQAP